MVYAKNKYEENTVKSWGPLLYKSIQFGPFQHFISNMSRPMSIVVTVGTTRTPFPELFEWVETHCQQHTVFVQHGPYNPPRRHLTSYVEFLPHAQLLEKMKAADIIIAHGGIHALPTVANTHPCFHV